MLGFGALAVELIAKSCTFLFQQRLQIRVVASGVAKSFEFSLQVGDALTVGLAAVVARTLPRRLGYHHDLRRCRFWLLAGPSGRHPRVDACPSLRVLHLGGLRGVGAARVTGGRHQKDVRPYADSQQEGRAARSWLRPRPFEDPSSIASRVLVPPL